MAAAMQAIRAFYFPDAAGGERTRPVAAELPVYVMFVTDGGTSDQATTEKQLRWASNEPIFWQFTGIGKGRKSKSKFLAAFADSDFPFLENSTNCRGAWSTMPITFPSARPTSTAMRNCMTY